MPAVIEKIVKNSIADDLGLKKGDIIQKVNDTVPRDLLDYRYFTTAEEITLEVLHSDGEVEIIDIEKDFDEDLGIVFESAVFDKIKACANHCIFCFVDQQPEGLRESLYVKDDDYRLSYLQGTYITMTNLTKKDKERISDMYLGPLYVSIHTTNPQLRAKMLNNKRAANIIDDLKWLQEVQIPIHGQIVLCPGYNDGEELERTLNDLSNFEDILLSLAVVPVGVTKYRKNYLKRVDKECAIDVVNRLDNFNKKLKRNVACASDEFFLLAEKEIPPRKYYGEFGQIEDGVGSLRLLLDDFDKNKKKLPKKLNKPFTLHILTSLAGKYAFEKINEEFNKIENLTSVLLPIKGKFFGENITVAGLITGSDIIDSLLPMKNEISTLSIPSVMLKENTKTFLDGKTVEDVEKELECKIFIVEDIYSTIGLVDFIRKLEK